MCAALRRESNSTNATCIFHCSVCTFQISMCAALWREPHSQNSTCKIYCRVLVFPISTCQFDGLMCPNHPKLNKQSLNLLEIRDYLCTSKVRDFSVFSKLPNYGGRLRKILPPGVKVHFPGNFPGLFRPHARDQGHMEERTGQRHYHGAN